MENPQLQVSTDIKQSEPSGNLQKKLKTRHISMIALGGTIGTGVFLGTGPAIHAAGPGGVLVAYSIIGIMVYFVMTGLGELATFMPTSGSISTYATRFIDPALGFAFGWNYWLSWAMTLAAELSASVLLMKYWFPDSPSLLWSGLFLAMLFLLNILSVKGFGEGEYWFSFIKVATIIIFIVVGILMIFGVMNGSHPVGFKNFTVGDAPFVGGFLGTLGIFLVAGFSFSGTECIGVAAGETENPVKNIPRAIRSVFWRILLFYVLAILVISFLVPYTNESLQSSSVLTSPFTIVFQRAGFALAASVMNAVILTAVLSAGNSCLYVTSRIMYAMAKDGQAPRIFTKVTKSGVPVAALVATTLIGMLAFLASFVGDGTIYLWLMNSVGVTTFIFWLGIALSHYRFRKAYVAQGNSISDLPYRAKWYPFGPIFAFVICFVILLAQDYQGFTSGHIDWQGVFAAYLGIPVFLVFWLGYKFIKKTKVIPLQECKIDVKEFHQ
ncbi:lysine-specific permease [Neobacillus vireti LMG 21834]|uniref:Lysine-specific permease n=2 Tax=Neobacillus TaxID=2675232 RepID=A0AB94IR16_9BACI|nr:lysine-specific permease [Neobacillus vireti LMG 21834]KLT17778.1 gamma-aminobutyrate permease [Neobacillus vireti]